MFDDDDISAGCDNAFFDDCLFDHNECFDTNSLSPECMWHVPMGIFSTDNDD